MRGLKHFLTYLLVFGSSAFADTPPPITILNLKAGSCSGYVNGLNGRLYCNAISAGGSSLTFLAPLVSQSGTVSITQAGALTDGYLSSADWSIFSAKQTSGSYITQLFGDAQAVGPGLSPTLINTVGGASAASVANSSLLVSQAASAAIPLAIVKRDSSGNFSANQITASLLGSATTANSATNFSGSLAGDVSGTQAATVVDRVGGASAASVANSSTLVSQATSSATPSAIVRRDASGNFSATTITAALSGNATSATTTANFSGSLSGDVSGTQGATVVDRVGGRSSSAIAATVVSVNNATALATPSTIALRNSSGNFAANNITANFLGNASTASVASTATNFTGSLSGDVQGTQSTTLVNTILGVSAASVGNSSILVSQATSEATPNTIVRRDSNGDIKFTGPLVISSGGTGQRTISAAATFLTPTTISISGTNVIDWSYGFGFVKHLIGNTTFTMANLKDNQTITTSVRNSTGNFTVTWPAYIRWVAGTPPTQTIGNTIDICTFTSIFGGVFGSCIQNFNP